MSLYLASNHQCDRNRFIISISKYDDDQNLLRIHYSTSFDFHPEIEFNTKNRSFIVSNELVDAILSKQFITKLESEFIAIEHNVLFDEKAILDIESDTEFAKYMTDNTHSDDRKDILNAIIYSCVNGMYVIVYRTMMVNEDGNSVIIDGISPMTDSHLVFRFLRRIKMKLF